MSKAIKFEMKNPAWTGFMLAIGISAAVTLGDHYREWAKQRTEPPMVVYFSPELSMPHAQPWPGGPI